MYIGITVSDSFISAGSLNKDKELVWIYDEHATSEAHQRMPLEIYIEDNYAYLGDPVRFLHATTDQLESGKITLKDLAKGTAIVYTDSTGVQWSSIMLLAIFLKKIKTDIALFKDKEITCAVVTINGVITTTITEAVQQAFNIAKLPLCGLIEVGKAALRGYRIASEAQTTKEILHLNIDDNAIAIGVLSFAEDNYVETRFFRNTDRLGSEQLHQMLMLYMIKRYKEITKKVIKKNKKNASQLNALVQELITEYTTSNKLCFKLTCDFYPPIIEIIITRGQIQALFLKYVQKVLSFLKASMESKAIEISSISDIMITGNSVIPIPIEPSLEVLFANQKVVIHNNKKAEAIMQGTASYANNTADREISSSMLPTTSKLPVALGEKKIEEDKDTLNINTLATLISNMQINAGCDTVL